MQDDIIQANFNMARFMVSISVLVAIIFTHGPSQVILAPTTAAMPVPEDATQALKEGLDVMFEVAVSKLT